MLSDPVRGQSPVAGDVNPRMGGALDNDRGANAPCDETRNEPPRNTITRDVANRIYVFTFYLSPFTIYPIHLIRHIYPFHPSPFTPFTHYFLARLPYRAFLAMRFAGRADVASVQQQPVVGA